LEKDLLFVDEFDKRLRAQDLESKRIIALSPMTMHKLDGIGVAYKIPEDYYVWEEPEGYEEHFEKWIDLFMGYMNSDYKEDFRYYITLLKNIVDPMMRNVTQFEKIIEVEQPNKVTLMTSANNKDYISEQLWYRRISCYKRMFYAYLQTNKIGNWEHLIVKETPMKQEESWRDNVKLRWLYDKTRTLSWLPHWRRGKEGILFAGCMPTLVRSAKLKGYKTVWNEPKGVTWSKGYYGSYFGDPGYEVFYHWEKLGIKREYAHTFLSGRLVHLINVVLPKIYAYKDYYIKLMEKDEFSHVIFTRRKDPYQYALLLAAKQFGIPCVYVRHGWDAYDQWWRKQIRFWPYDYHVCSTEFDKSFYKGRVKEWNLRTIVM